MGSDFKFDGDAYLDRIGIQGPIAISEESLEQLHRAQAYTIPFENFDILPANKTDA